MRNSKKKNPWDHPNRAHPSTMSGVSDKARFYLEQSVPELQDDLRKQIFSREEIASITKKRSDFEHVLNARGSTPADYIRYAEYEMNLNSLRLKRIKRLGIKTSNYTGARRIFFVLDRGTRKFQGDLGLWMQYISFARSQKSYKKLEQILTSVLRLHPTKAQLWIYAASYSLEVQADIGGARGYMQRGVRFCTKSRNIWVEYAKLEMIYIAKIEGRRRILGLDQDRTAPEEMEVDDTNADEIALPSITAEDINPNMPKDDSIDEVALQNLAASPVLNGAIPIAVFDAAIKEFNNDPAVAEAFFDMFTEFANISCTKRILQHILEILETSSADTVPTLCCAFRLHIIGVKPSSAVFPSALRQTLDGVKKAQAASSSPIILEKAILCLTPIAAVEELDIALEKVVKASLRQYLKKLNNADVLTSIVEKLAKDKHTEQARTLAEIATAVHAGNEQLVKLKATLGGT